MSYGTSSIGTRAIGGGAPVGPAASTSSYTRSVSDSAPATAVATRVAVHPRTVSDNALATAVATRIAVHPRAASDSAPSVASATRIVVDPRTASDSAPATAAGTRVVVATRTSADSAPAVDTAEGIRIVSVTVFEDAPADDLPTTTVVYVRGASDSALASDAADVVVTPAHRWADAIAYGYVNVGVHLTASGDDVAYGYYGSVSTGQPTPHIWYITPDTVPEGHPASVSVIGLGFGDEEALYAASVFLDDVPLPFIQIVSWAVVEPSPTEDPVIDAASDHVNVEHQRFSFLVPVNQETTEVTVHTRIFEEVS